MIEPAQGYAKAPVFTSVIENILESSGSHGGCITALTLKADSSNERIRAESLVEMSLHQGFAAHLILLERTTWTADIGHLLAAATIERFVAIVTVFGHLVDHCGAVVQRCALRAEGALCAPHRLTTDIGSG